MFTTNIEHGRSHSGLFISIALWGIWLLLIGFGVATLIDSDWASELSSSEKQQTALRFEKLGEEALSQGDMRSAIGYFERALEVDSSLGDGMIGLARAYQALGDEENAITLYREGLANNPIRPDRGYGNLGVLYANRGNLDTAISLYWKGAETAPEPTGALIGLGQIYIHMDKPDSAIIVLDNALKNLGDIEIAYRAALSFAGEFYRFDSEVIEEVTGQKGKDIDDKILLNYDDVILKRSRLHSSEAFSAYKFLGIAHAMGGDYDRSIEQFKNALEIDSNPTVLRMLREIEEEKKMRLNP